MIIITDMPDTITIENPHDSESSVVYKGKLLSEYAFVSFLQHGIYWSWTLVEVDTPIANGKSSPNSGKTTIVNPSGFIYGDEIVKIEVSPL